MDYKLFDIFPLTVFQDKIRIEESEKNKIIDFIFDTEKNSQDSNKRQGDAWLGDTKGHEYLFKNKIMHNLANLIGQKIKIYTNTLNLDNDKLSFFYQRTWATITKKKERIQPHSHDQSNISFAYYPLKPKDTGDIRFIVEPQNEIAKGLFHEEKFTYFSKIYDSKDNLSEFNVKIFKINFQQSVEGVRNIQSIQIHLEVKKIH